ncbi:MAG: hypothetical protein HY986_13755 [Candidatus Melainabacteria bacterium]|nr:hypothetical protein [Candidatus Melainabacteria bacterium]
MLYPAALKRIFSLNYFKHAVNFTLAARSYLLAPVLLSAIVGLLLKVPESIIGPAGLEGTIDVGRAIPLLLSIMVVLVMGGVTTIIGMALMVWRLAVVTRAYLRTPYSDAPASRLQFEEALEEAKTTLGKSKARLVGVWLLLSVAQIPILAVCGFALCALLLVTALPGTVQIPAEIKALVEPYRVHLVVSLIISALLLNNFTVVGGARSVTLSGNALKVVIDSLVITFTKLLSMSLMLILLTILGTFVTNPDIIMQIQTQLKSPGYSEPLWIIFFRQTWLVLSDQFLLPFGAAAMLETIREACVRNGQPTAPSQAVPGEGGSNETSEGNSSSPNTDKVIVDLEDA